MTYDLYHIEPDIRGACSVEALARIDEVGMDDDALREDARLVAGLLGEGASEAAARAVLLERCLNGADADRETGWRAYVDAVMGEVQLREEEVR
jgi:hypothetical protein